MANIAEAILTLPFRIFTGLVREIVFPPKPISPEEQLLKKVRKQFAQIRAQQDEINGLLSSIREREFLMQNYDELLAKREAEIKRFLKKIRDLEFEKFQK